LPWGAKLANHLPSRSIRRGMISAGGRFGASKPTHSDIAQARAAAEAIRNEHVAALGPDPDCPVPIP